MPTRRAIRLHPLRGQPTGWSALEVVPWHDAGRFTGDGDDPGDRLDYHTGLVYPQDAASQVPVLLLAPRPGEVVIDTCAAPGSKTSQIGIALGDAGVVVACDADPRRRAVLGEVLARQGVTAAVVTPMPVAVLAERRPGCADGVLVDAPCSGHLPSPTERQCERLAVKQGRILADAARLVRPGGRLVYSTCTDRRIENEDVVRAFLDANPGWRPDPATLPGCDADLDGLGGLRLGAERQGTEPFFAIRLVRDQDGPVDTLAGDAPEPLPLPWPVPGTVMRLGGHAVAVTAAAAACALPAEVRGLRLGRIHERGCEWQPWGAQWLASRGAPATVVAHGDAAALWAGATMALPDAPFAVTDRGAPLGVLAGPPDARRLDLPSRMRRAGLR